MRRLAIAAFAYTWALTGAAAEEKVLNVFTWPDYIAPDTIANFEAEYGIKVNYDTYDSTEMAEASRATSPRGRASAARAR